MAPAERIKKLVELNLPLNTDLRQLEPPCSIYWRKGGHGEEPKLFAIKSFCLISENGLGFDYEREPGKFAPHILNTPVIHDVTVVEGGIVHICTT